MEYRIDMTSGYMVPVTDNTELDKIRANVRAAQIASANAHNQAKRKEG